MISLSLSLSEFASLANVRIDQGAPREGEHRHHARQDGGLLHQ